MHERIWRASLHRRAKAIAAGDLGPTDADDVPTRGDEGAGEMASEESARAGQNDGLGHGAIIADVPAAAGCALPARCAPARDNGARPARRHPRLFPSAAGDAGGSAADSRSDTS